MGRWDDGKGGLAHRERVHESIGVAKLAPHDLRLRAGREQSRPATRLLGSYGVMA
jgi:hypothetical protein